MTLATLRKNRAKEIIPPDLKTSSRAGVISTVCPITQIDSEEQRAWKQMDVTISKRSLTEA